MRDTFNDWLLVCDYDIDTTSNLILTGKTAKTASPDDWLTSHIGDPAQKLKILDFGCGVGRNTFHIGTLYPMWEVVGYDSDNMISKTNEYYSIHYSRKMSDNISFESNWDDLKTKRFDVIFCCLVLQHIYENALYKYVNDFKTMSSKLIVSGRRFNDDIKNRSTWTILEEFGLMPHQFFNGHELINYNPIGEPEEHNLAIYIL